MVTVILIFFIKVEAQWGGQLSQHLLPGAPPQHRSVGGSSRLTDADQANHPDLMGLFSAVDLNLQDPRTFLWSFLPLQRISKKKLMEILKKKVWSQHPTLTLVEVWAELEPETWNRFFIFLLWKGGSCNEFSYVISEGCHWFILCIIWVNSQFYPTIALQCSIAI